MTFLDKVIRYPRKSICFLWNKLCVIQFKLVTSFFSNKVYIGDFLALYITLYWLLVGILVWLDIYILLYLYCGSYEIVSSIGLWNSRIKFKLVWK